LSDDDGDVDGESKEEEVINVGGIAQ